MAQGLRAAWARARERRWVRWGVDALLFVAVLGAVMAWQTRGLPGGGVPAPPLTLRTLEGETVSLADLRGRPVALTFWAPWCAVCKAESSTLDAVRETVGGRAHVLSVAVGYRDEAGVRRFVRERGAGYPVLLGDGATQAAWRVEQFPTTFFLTADGRVERAAVGYTTRAGFLWRLFF